MAGCKLGSLDPKSGILFNYDGPAGTVVFRVALPLLPGDRGIVALVTNTHYHGCHTGGNANFGGARAIIAHDNVRKRLIRADAKASLRVNTFDHDVTVHGNGDAIVFFPKSNVVHMGDDFVRYGFPFIDVASGGSVQGMIDAMENALVQLPADVKVIPGHGAISALDDVREYVKMLKATSAIVQKGISAGKTLCNSLTNKQNAGFMKHNE